MNNKFRLNLHPALYFPWGNGNGERPEEKDIPAPQNEIISEAQNQERAVETSVKNNENAISLSVDDLCKEFSGGLGENYLLDDRERFKKRCAEKNSENKTYHDVWTLKINGWLGHLITALKESNYFDGKNEQAELSRIKDLYTKEVKKQYKENVRSARDGKFKKVKDTLFGRDSEDYPANKIYKDLTGAASIFAAKRSISEGYDVTILEDVDDGKFESWSDRSNRNFLSNKLTQYLWGIRKTPWILNVMKWLPIFKVNIDKPSDVDRKALNSFLKVSSRLDVKGGKDPAVALIEAFRTNKLGANSWKDAYKQVLWEKWISFKKDKEKYWNDLVKVWNFYFSTQAENLDSRNQHAIYLSVLKIIETEWWVKNAVEKYKDLVDRVKQDRKQERQEWYAEGEKLKTANPELYALATKLKITDFTNATRLSDKSSDYFARNTVENILANLNNDISIDSMDVEAWWTKSWQQFLEVVSQVGKDVALKKLSKRAKQLNEIQSLGLPDNLFNEEGFEGEIKKWNKQLILLLQNIISNPWEDLITLLWEHTRVEVDKQRLEEAKQQAEVAAREMAWKIDLEWLKSAGLESLPTSDQLQSGLAATLYSEYTKWIWLWGQVSFDKWVKWLEMNTWFQVRDDGGVVLWIWLSYKKEVNLWRWWSMTPMFSAWWFIPLWYGRPELWGSAGFSIETAKRWITENWVAAKIWVDAGVTVMNTGTVILSAWIGWYRDKLAWIETAEQNKREEMKKMIWSILSDVSTKMHTWDPAIKTPVLDLDNAQIRKIVEDVIKAKATEKWVGADQINNVVQGTIRALLPYNWLDMANQDMVDIAANWVADQYAMAWANQRKSDITNSAYLSGANLGVFWIAGSPMVWIYAWLRVTKHNLDGYGDRWWQDYNLDHQYETGRSDNLINGFNQEAWLKGPKALKMAEIEGKKYVVIPKGFAYGVHVNEKLKWNMKKDKDWNILLHPQTPMASKRRVWSATHGSEIIIGWRKWENFLMLDNVWDDWFTTGELNQTEILNLWEGIRTYSADVINKALAELKAKFPAGDKIQKFEIKEDKMKELVDEANKINSKEKPHKVKLIIDEVGWWELGVSLAESLQEWRWLEIEYQAKFEMIDPEAQKVAKLVYDEALKLKDPTFLWQVKHTTNWNKPRPEYADFDKAMQSADYALAKGKIKPIFEELDKKYKGASHFTEILNQLDKIQDPNALGQALMSIRNVFARAKNVQWLGDRYGFSGERLWMSSIIERRASKKQIRWTIDKSNMPNEYKTAYLSLIDASEKYRLANRKLFEVKEANAAQLSNTVWFNLWDHTNPENPLFNPEIYNPMIDLKDLESHGFSADQRNKLHQRAMENFAQNPVLIAPILKALWLDDTTKPTVKEFKDWQLTLDIWGKTVTLKAEMKFGYFTQCVNHTVILSNISATWPEGTSVQFNSGVWENGSYREWNKTSIVSSTEVSAGVAVITGRNKPDEVKTDDATTWWKIPEWPDTPAVPEWPDTPAASTDWSGGNSNGPGVVDTAGNWQTTDGWNIR